jgi:methylthioribulose-1-phosphate dehydratase
MWMFATAGNLSILDADQKVLKITASGRDKSNLSPQDFIDVDPISGVSLNPSSTMRPSAETSIHTALYALDSSINCILHVHTPASCALEFGMSKSHPSLWTLLPNTEILKAFGDFTEEPNLKALVVHNHGHVPDIANEMKVCLKKQPSRVPFFLIENHGVTAWGKNVYDANKNLEAAEFVLQVMTSRQKNIHISNVF